MQGPDVQVRKPHEQEVREFLENRITEKERELEIELNSPSNESAVRRAQLRNHIDLLRGTLEMLFGS